MVSAMSLLVSGSLGCGRAEAAVQMHNNAAVFLHQQYSIPQLKHRVLQILAPLWPTVRLRSDSELNPRETWRQQLLGSGLRVKGLLQTCALL